MRCCLKNIENEVVPFISEDKRPAVIFALRDIIQRDKHIDLERKESFIKYLEMDKKRLLQQSEFVFPSFLGRILLYTVYGESDNTVGKDSVKSITKEHIDEFINHFGHEYEWDQTKQTLKLLFIEVYSLFYQAIMQNDIFQFVEGVDPTDRMHDEWIDRCESFLTNTKSDIWIPYAPVGSDELGLTLGKVQEFAQTLDDYMNYLGIHMRPIAECPETLVPI